MNCKRPGACSSRILGASRQNLTLNYGLRWDFTGDDHDLKNAYESAGLDGVWGPSGAGNEFKPGTLRATRIRS